MNELTAKRKEHAEAQFGQYVTSTAFSMSLSRNMVAFLGAVRDNIACDDKRFHSMFSMCCRGLERRGLIYHDYVPPIEAPKGHRYFKLTKAGDLMCKLLVEASLLEPKNKRRAV